MSLSSTCRWKSDGLSLHKQDYSEGFFCDSMLGSVFVLCPHQHCGPLTHPTFGQYTVDYTCIFPKPPKVAPIFYFILKIGSLSKQERLEKVWNKGRLSCFHAQPSFLDFQFHGTSNSLVFSVSTANWTFLCWHAKRAIRLLCVAHICCCHGNRGELRAVWRDWARAGCRVTEYVHLEVYRNFIFIQEEVWSCA